MPTHAHAPAAARGGGLSDLQTALARVAAGGAMSGSLLSGGGGGGGGLEAGGGALSARAPIVSGGAMLLRPMACIRELAPARGTAAPTRARRRCRPPPRPVSRASSPFTAVARAGHVALEPLASSAKVGCSGSDALGLRWAQNPLTGARAPRRARRAPAGGFRSQLPVSCLFSYTAPQAR